MVQSFEEKSLEERVLVINLFNEMLQNEQQKAIQAMNAFSSRKDFGGTSISSLIRRPCFKHQLEPKNYEELAKIIADAYISESSTVLDGLRRGFTPEEVDLFNEHGVFYGVHLSPKLLGLVEGLTIDHKDLLLKGFPDPYSLPKESREVVEAYLGELKRQRGLDITLRSLVLADTTTPRGYEGKKILNPSGLNDKLVKLSDLTTCAIKNAGKRADSLYFLATDTDSPERTLITEGLKPIDGYVLTPGLTMCGSTATMSGFDFKYSYRIGLIAQGITNNIVASKISGEYSPFMFVGMLSPFGYTNGAIPTNEMGRLRYPGDIDLKKEFLFQHDNCVRKLID